MSEPAATTVESPASKARYLDLFERAIDTILLTDISTGTIHEANDAAEKFFRLHKDKLHGKSVYDFCPKESLSELKKMVRIASRRYHPKTWEIPMIVGSTIEPINITAEIAISPLKLNDGSEVLQFFFKDVTKQKEAEAKIQAYIKQIEEMATTDGLTSLTNVRQFNKILESEHARALRYRSKYAIVFFDIDHFKHFNDKNGHPAGDALLKQFGQILKKAVRTTDTPARYGGEEFVILLPETDAIQASHIAERIRTTIASTPFEHRENQPMKVVSASIGVSSFPQDGAEPKQIMKAADDMLYRSKKGGRNRVTVSTGEALPEIHTQEATTH